MQYGFLGAGLTPTTGPNFSLTSFPDFAYSLPDRRAKDQSSGNGISSCNSNNCN